jgi:O-antigen/teichoic acid export membrane protein
MSAVTEISPPVIGSQPAPRRGRLFGKNIWAMGDQVLISGTNFLTTVLIARALLPSVFGTFTLVYSALLLANIFQSTLITQAHNVLGANRTGEPYRRYTTSTALSQLMLLGIEAAISLIVVLVAQWKGSPNTRLLMWVAPAIIAWQLQEFIRRVLYTECRFAAAFWNDSISYGVQTILVAFLWFTKELTGVSAMFALTVTSAAAVILGLYQIQKSLEWNFDPSILFENWTFGKWLIGGELVQWFASLQLYLFLAAYMLGTHATGELKAAQTIFGPTRVFSFYLGTVLPIRFARALAKKGSQAVDSLLLHSAIRVLPLLGLYCFLIALFPRLLMQLMFGRDYAGTPAVLSLYSIYAFMTYAQTLLVSVLTAKRLTHTIFIANVYGTLITLAMSYWIISYFKVAGATIAIGISSLIITAYLWHAYQKSRGDVAVVTTGVLQP